MGSGLKQTIICPEVYSGFHQSFQQRPWTFRDRVNKCLNKLNRIHISIPKYFNISFNTIIYRGPVLGLTELSVSSDFRSQFYIKMVLIPSFIPRLFFQCPVLKCYNVIRV